MGEVPRDGARRDGAPVPLQRLGTVQEHAWLVALLASPLGSAFSGSTITLDGARDNWLGRGRRRGWLTGGAVPGGAAVEVAEVGRPERCGGRCAGLSVRRETDLSPVALRSGGRESNPHHRLGRARLYH